VNLLSAPSVERAATPGKAAAQVLVLNLDGQLYIRDLAGTASLQWNGNPTAQANLRHGDKVRLGKIEYDVRATRFATGQSPAAGPPAELLSGEGVAMTIHTPVSLVGSSEQAELRLPGDNVPGVMAMILRIGQGYWLWNLDAAFPCRVNGEPVVRVALAEGSVVSLAGREFRFRQRPEAMATVEAKPVNNRPPKSRTKAKRSAARPAEATPAAAPLAPPPAPAAGPLSSPQPQAKPSVVVKLPSTPASKAPPQPISQLANALPPGLQASSKPVTLDDEADVFKQWGPLAFAVAAADRPELQPSGSRAPAPEPTAPEPKSSNPSWRRWVGGLTLLILLGAGAFFAWHHFGGQIHL
jgi:hypothetical protein